MGGELIQDLSALSRSMLSSLKGSGCGTRRASPIELHRRLPTVLFDGNRDVMYGTPSGPIALPSPITFYLFLTMDLRLQSCSKTSWKELSLALFKVRSLSLRAQRLAARGTLPPSPIFVAPSRRGLAPGYSLCLCMKGKTKSSLNERKWHEYKLGRIRS